jgi:hypothetical protein
MVYRSSQSLTREERRREEVWRAAVHEAGEVARSRFLQLAHLLELPPESGRAFVGAALEVSRYYHEQCTYANYERRAGHPYPMESHTHDQVIADRTWTAELDRLRDSVRKQ